MTITFNNQFPSPKTFFVNSMFNLLKNMFLLCYFASSLKAIFGIFDGHGGREVGDFARKNLWHIIKQQKGFYSEDKAQIIKAIKAGFVNVPLEM